ncbi:hypothetical protein KR018_011125 [Drosophila ironensis]|nr:hypothetical protein KR018_011125 [Drosophila ironensis]
MSEQAVETPPGDADSPATGPLPALPAPDSVALEEPEAEEKPPAGKTPAKKPKKGKKADASNQETGLKKLAQRRINVAGAPKMPLNGYVRFMNDRREELRRERPQCTALEHTKIIGEEWHNLPEERKQPYMEAAAKDKAIYQSQLQLFLKEHPEIVANELSKAKKATKAEGTPKQNPNKSNSAEAKGKKAKAKATPTKRHSEDPDDVPLAQVKRTPTPTPTATPAPAPAPVPPANAQPVAPPPPPARPLQPGEIPIYTHEFIEHNRSTENELRTLRKAKTDLEQQNAVLEQHVENTKAGYAKVMGEVAELKEENSRLESYLHALRQKLVASLAGISLPPLEPSGLSVDNVDKYVRHVASLAGQPNNALLLKARDSLRKLDTSSLLKP